MHRTNAANNVANEFTNGTPPLTPGTAIDAADLNTWQRELVAVVENAGIALDANDDTQVLQALDAVYAQLSADNTFGGQNTFGSPTTFDEVITASGGISVGASAASILPSGRIATDGNISAQGTLTVFGGTSLQGGLSVTGGGVSSSGNVTAPRAVSSSGGLKVQGATAATGVAPAAALELENGHLKLSGTAPNSTAALLNLVTPTTANKANAMITISSGAASVSAGANVSGVAGTAYGSNNALRVSWAQAFASVNYVVVPTAWGNSTPRHVAAVVTKATGYVDIILYRTDTQAQIDVSNAATSAVIELVAYGVQ